MKQLSYYKRQLVKKNLEHAFNNATTQDIEEGLTWYEQANEFCERIANKYNVEPFTVASVVSALSPRNKWDKNLLDAELVIKNHQKGISPEKTSVSTFHRNKFKAFAILDGTESITPESQKTYAFVKNISELSSDFVTVDVWHLRACFGKTMASVGNLAYKQLENITKELAKESGFTPYQYQAIVWGYVRREFTN